MSDASNADAWGLTRVVEFFDEHRAATEEVYDSEWFFLRDRLREGMSVLDIGCAQGGFASVLAEHVNAFRYTGVDINAEMIARARRRHPDSTFHHAPDGTLAALENQRFDLVLVLGILHLHETWRESVRAAWNHTAGSLVMDLRQTDGATIEDKAVSSFRMDFNGGGESHSRTRLPYNIINAADALRIVREQCPDAKNISQYGYQHAVSSAADCPMDTVMTTTWCVER